MPEVEYSNREIDAKFDIIMETLHRIEAQTIKTNGRVSKLEMWRETLIAKVSGVAATLGILWVVIKEVILK